MMELYKWSIPKLLAMFGVRKWLKDRALHVPERYLAGWCAMLTRALDIQITPYRWRKIEARMMDLLYGGVLVETGPDAGDQ